jgi:hypothetical protein
MNPQSPSRAATVGYNLLTLALWFVVAFTAFAFVSLAVGAARGGDSLLGAARSPSRPTSIRTRSARSRTGSS